MAKSYELERKFLLLTSSYQIIPNEGVELVTNNLITQFYVLEDDVLHRYRSVSKGEDISYYLTIKHQKDHGVFEEKEQEIDSDRFHQKLMKDGDVARTQLVKIRSEVIIENNRWMIDEFTNLSLTVAEVEIISSKEDLQKNTDELYQIKVPELLQNHILKEVTGMEEFSNYSIYKKLEKLNLI